MPNPWFELFASLTGTVRLRRLPLNSNFMKHKSIRILAGSLLTIATITFIAVLLQWILGIENNLQKVTTLAMAVTAPMVSGIILLVWGLPIYFVLEKMKKHKIGWYALAGFIPAPVFVFLFKPMGNDRINDLINQSLFLGVMGTAGATVFWFFVVKIPHGKSVRHGAKKNDTP